MTLVCFAVGGVVYGPFVPLTYALFQSVTTTANLPSVLAARSAALIVAAPLGATLGGPIVAGIGAGWTLTVSGGATVVLAASATVLWRRDPARMVIRGLPPTHYDRTMSGQSVPGGVVHKLPADLRVALIANATALDAWKDITPLARNEFICWVEDAKQQTTRERRIRRTQEELEEGKRRPCCWPGCSHRERNGR